MWELCKITTVSGGDRKARSKTMNNYAENTEKRTETEKTPAGEAGVLFYLLKSKPHSLRNALAMRVAPI